jgi:hypothetical protein
MTLPYSGRSAISRLTSRRAAEAAEPKSGTIRLNVLDAIRASGLSGLTDSQIQRALGLDGSTERPRRIELQRANWITSGPARRTQSGRMAVTWIAIK